MEDIRRILAVSRMTTYCRKVVHYGISLSEKYNALLYVIHVMHNPPGLEGWNLPPLEHDFTMLFKKSKEDIDAAIKEERATGMDIREVIREGDPTQVIMDVAKEEN
ncbi:MAG TPA: universal stress protein [Candidatus Sulfobium mesophilum]|nr:universal stress protein [Candidatus Sulfobium mesophilum]